jgi:hypothetical protein
MPAVETSEIAPKAVGAVGDGGLAWLKKSFSNAKQQAAESGKSLEDIVAQRWGVSFQNLCLVLVSCL